MTPLQYKLTRMRGENRSADFSSTGDTPIAD
jgi:hypothetical protein